MGSVLEPKLILKTKRGENSLRYWKKLFLSVLIEVFFYSQYVDIILFAFALSSRSRSSHWRCSIKKLRCFRGLRADEYEQVLRLWLKADKTKNKKRFHRNYNYKFFIYICIILSMFLFFDEIMFEKRFLKWPHVMLCMEFTAFFPMNPFLWPKTSWQLSPYMG